MSGVSQPRALLDRSWKQPSSNLEKNNMESSSKNSENHCEETCDQRNWAIKASKLGGRGLFATRNIQKGTLIFENRPLVIGPRADCTGKLFCTTCYELCDSSYKCDKCHMLICSEQCDSSSNHTKICAFITNNWTPKPNREGYSEILSCVLIYLRFMLLENELKSLVNLLQKAETPNIVEIETLRSLYVIPEAQLQFMSTVYSVIKINSFRISYNPQGKSVPLRGLYPLSSFLNHTCVPNTRNMFKQDYTMAVYATRDIEIGEEILACYTGLLWSTPARRCQLFKTKNFWCKCNRCEDKTEMSTNLSALKCLKKECIGVLLPISPTNPRSDWICDNCDSKVNATRISDVQSVLGSLVGTLDLDDQFRLETSVLERLAKFVPYTSHIFVDLRLRLALRVGFTGLKLNGIRDLIKYGFKLIFNAEKLILQCNANNQHLINLIVAL